MEGSGQAQAARPPTASRRSSTRHSVPASSTGRSPFHLHQPEQARLVGLGRSPARIWDSSQCGRMQFALADEGTGPGAVRSFTEKLAVVTGGGSGIGRELVRQLAAEGCSVAACDLNPQAIEETAAMARADAPPGVLVTGHACDVAEEAQVLRFRDEVLEQHVSDHVDLVFNNAGIGGGGSFVKDDRDEWERVFAVDWWGVYHCARAFLPLLTASPEGVLVNTSSLNGIWAAVGPGMPQTAYSTAKFAVRGFSEALIEDLRTHAPHVRVAVVMPGHVGTDIVANSIRARGLPEPGLMSDAQVEELFPPDVQAKLISAHLLPEGATAD